MTVHLDDLNELLAQAEKRREQLQEKTEELDEAKTELHFAIQHNREQKDRATQTIKSLEFLIATLYFEDDTDEDDDQSTVGGPLTR